MEQINRSSAFVVREAGLIPEILRKAINPYHIYLIGEHNVNHPKVSIIKTENIRQIAGTVAKDMLKRNLLNIVCKESEVEIKNKIIELQTIDSNYALRGGALTAMDNVWCNLPLALNGHTIESIKDLYKDYPVIVVSSGPSLNKNIGKLKELQNKAIIIACSSSLAVLLRNDIKPHFLIALDPFDLMNDQLAEYFDNPATKDITLVSALMLNKKLVNNWPGEKMFFLGEYDSRILGNTIPFTGLRSILVTNATITTSAFAFAYHLGCNPVILVGQDMCYQDNVQHAGDIDTKVGANLFDCELIDIWGNNRPTCLAYKEIFDFFNALIPGVKDRTVINATEGGAGIKGAEHLTLAEVAETYIKNEFTLEPFTKLPYEKEKFINKITEIKKDFKVMLHNAQVTAKEVDKLIGKDDKKALEKIKKQFINIKAYESYAYIMPYIDWIYFSVSHDENTKNAASYLFSLEAIILKMLDLLDNIATTLA